MKVKDFKKMVAEIDSEHDNLEVATSEKPGGYYRPVEGLLAERKDIAFHPAIKDRGDDQDRAETMLYIEIAT